MEREQFLTGTQELCVLTVVYSPRSHQTLPINQPISQLPLLDHPSRTATFPSSSSPSRHSILSTRRNMGFCLCDCLPLIRPHRAGPGHRGDPVSACWGADIPEATPSAPREAGMDSAAAASNEGPASPPKDPATDSESQFTRLRRSSPWLCRSAFL